MEERREGEEHREVKAAFRVNIPPTEARVMDLLGTAEGGAVGGKERRGKKIENCIE